LRAGTYDFARLYIHTPNITLARYLGASVRLNGMIKVLPGGAGTTIEGLELNGLNSNAGCTGTCGGGSPRIYANNVVLRNDEITNRHTGICVTVGSYYSNPPPKNVRIANNSIHDCGRLPKTNHDHGIYLAESRDAVIRNNWIYQNADRGIQLYPDADGSRIYGNVIFGNGEGVNFSCDSSSCSKDNVVQGNVIASSSTRWNVYGHSQGATPDGSNVLRNNCLFATTRGYADSGGVDSNSRFFRESGNMVARPQFINPFDDNFRLRAGVPCLAKYTGLVPLLLR